MYFVNWGLKKWGIILESKVPPNLNMILKVIKFQNEFMKSLFLPKYEQKIVRISALCKGQLISKSRLTYRRFSQKTNGQI